MKLSKKIFVVFTVCVLALSAAAFSACSNDEITVITRENGSGTRGAFIELTGVEVKDADGNKADKTWEGAVVQQNTEAVISGVEGNEKAIGYISLGSFKNSVKALKIGGVAASAENVKNGTYELSRPFNIAVKKGSENALVTDFVNFIMSTDGQEIISGSYISVDENAETFTSANPTGSIKVGGSSSVSPVMEKLIEAYEKINTGATIELLTSDSGTGMSNAAAGTYDIGMASRALKDSEKTNLDSTQIAIDGIAVIVNTANSLESLTVEQIRGIYLGETRNWSALGASFGK